MVPTVGRLLFQSLMRPLLIVGLAKGIKGSLLPSSVRLRRGSRLCLECPVQSLQPSVLLRVAGLDPLGYDAKLDPPYCQRRQAPQAYTGKGRSDSFVRLRRVGPQWPASGRKIYI